VGPGVTLVVIGAIFAFAIRKELPGIDIQVVGVILMVAGAAVIAHARYGRVREQKVRRVEAPEDPGAPTHSVVTEKTEREIR
jgi:membrane protein implicated in regulation of membrane protease activity